MVNEIHDVVDSIERIEKFNQKHDLGAKNQGLQLAAEEGELSDAILRDDVEGVKEEVGDVIFVAVSIALLYGFNPYRELDRVIERNMLKDATKEGDKVTKD